MLIISCGSLNVFLGEYLLYIKNAFGVSVKAAVAALSLPTKAHPRTLHVASGNLQKVVGGITGGIAVVSLLCVGWYTRKNPDKISQISTLAYGP